MTQHHETRTKDSFDGWLTPEWVLDLARKVGPIVLDPCTEESNPTNAQTWFWSHGLEQEWAPRGEGITWVNPPYGRALGPWSKKIVVSAQNTCPQVLVLVPARPDTKWFGHLWDNCDSVGFFRKRIKFHHPTKTGKDSPAFPNAIFYFGQFGATFNGAFEHAARMVSL